MDLKIIQVGKNAAYMFAYYYKSAIRKKYKIISKIGQKGGIYQ
jgi:hypothetical protein